MHMFCSCYLTADKSPRHTTVQYNVWLWPPLSDSLGAKGKHASLSSQQVLWQRGRPPSPSASAAADFRLCTLQPIAQGQTTLFRLSMSRHVCNLSGDGVKKCVTVGDPDEGWTNSKKISALITYEMATTQFRWEFFYYKWSLMWLLDRISG